MVGWSDDPMVRWRLAPKPLTAKALAAGYSSFEAVDFRCCHPQLWDIVKEMTSKDWASQMLQVPVGDGELMFERAWFKQWRDGQLPERLNYYLYAPKRSGGDLAEGDPKGAQAGAHGS